MKVLQTIQGLSARSGGPSTCTRDLMEGLQQLAPGEVELFTLRCSDPEDHNLGEGASWLKEAPCDYRTPVAFSHNVREFLRQSDYDLYHCNALWMFSNHETCRVAREKGRPYVVSPHGMLYPTALRISRWKKWPMLKLWFERDIMRATCLHATCMEEALHCRTFGYEGPIAVIPNPVVLPDEFKEASPLALSNWRGSTDLLDEGRGCRKTIGYLGRLHPIKKVENLLRGVAMALQRVENFELEIMGRGDVQYETFLHTEAERLGIADHVRFVGFVSGEDKYRRLARLQGLFVPSEQENFGMIVPEALICGTPVYASLGTPWEELNTCGCGWWRDNSPETIAEVIGELLAKSEDELLQMGANGRRLIEEKYEQTKVARMMHDLYKWILGECEKPEFVVMD